MQTHDAFGTPGFKYCLAQPADRVESWSPGCDVIARRVLTFVSEAFVEKLHRNSAWSEGSEEEGGGGSWPMETG